MEQVTETRSSRGYFRSSPSTAFDQYLQDIQKLPLIDDPEEERRLARRAQRGDEKAAERLVTANLRFVISYVKKYQGHGLDLSELVAIGNEGLLKAVRKFDPDQGVKFISYAVFCLKKKKKTQTNRPVCHTHKTPPTHATLNNTTLLPYSTRKNSLTCNKHN